MMALESWLAIASAVLSAAVAGGVYLLMNAERRRQRDIENMFRMESRFREKLSPDREYVDRQISKLLNELYHTRNGFERTNELVLQSINSQPPATITGFGETEEVLRISKFLKNLGIDVKSSLEVKEQYNHDVFVITPFSSEYRDDYNAIQSTCSSLDLKCVRGDEQYVSSNLLKHIVELIISSKFVIANISGRNSNVFYELAIAQMLEKPVIMICGLATNLDFDVNQQKVLLFGSRQELIDILTREIARMTARNSPAAIIGRNAAPSTT